MMQASEIADYLIAFSHEHGDPVSNLKLQKLLYYAQAWHLALHDEPLFNDRIEAYGDGGASAKAVRGAWRQPGRSPANRPGNGG
jgi:uncharacterized phage-associated protein